MAFREVEGTTFVSLEVGGSLEGTLRAIREGEYGPVYDFETAEGRETMGAKAVLANRIRQEFVGKKVRITRLADEMGRNGRVYQNFTVEVDE